MRKSSLLGALLPDVRQKLLAATLRDPARWHYASDLARRLGLRPSSLQRELAVLVAAGILMRRVEGRHVYYKPDPDCPILDELRAILRKTAGLVDVLREALRPFRSAIVASFVYGSVARGDEGSSSDVDLFIVGDVPLSKLASRLEKAEREIGRPVNPTVYSPAEFREKLRLRHHFVSSVAAAKKLFVHGGNDELEATPGRAPRAKAQNQPSGAR
ncbi:MAG: nucleotidyltransferase domain-containing protein [Planctomycetia bacterium]|nr:nucleotidyltransferase domain-containing protein [Planctomycetia bacterium]